MRLAKGPVVPTLALAFSLVHGCSGATPEVEGPDADASVGPDGGATGETSVPAPDATTVPDGASPAEIPLVNPSKYNTLVGRPTDRSAAVSVLAKAGDSAYVEVASAVDATRTSLVAPRTLAPRTSTSGEPIVLEIDGLSPDTRYYYRVVYTAAGGTPTQDALHTFHTRREKGKTFHFGVQGDTHPERFNDKMFHPELFRRTMEAVRDRQPDLYFTLGDDFSIEKIIETFKAQNYPAGHSFQRAVEGALPFSEYQALGRPFSQPMIVDGVGAPQGSAAYLGMRQDYFGLMGASTALMLTNGNHEQAHLANLGGVFNNASIWAAESRLKYYPLPAPGDFYSGDDAKLLSANGYPTLGGDGLLRDYYAFTWGDALFVTLDPYWHSPTVSPDSTLFDEPEPKWGATLGDAQYQWLKRTLESSTAKWKFVFAHHVNGNNRGGAAIVGSQEWGGEPGFSTNRPGWAKPIHQLFVDTKVTIFFQGHDHMYAREKVDGVVYQEVPNPADNSYFAYNCDAYTPPSITWQGPSGYGVYDAAFGQRLPNTGFLDVTVSEDRVRVDYVRTYRDVDLTTNPNKVFTGSERNGEVAFSYSIPSSPADSPRTPYTCLGAAPPAGWIYNR
ncbi:MAG: metallophosphoesterase [Polyangiaceae bacterium]